MSADNANSRNPLKEMCTALFFPLIFLWVLVSGFVDKQFLGGRFEKRKSSKLRESFAAEIQQRIPSLFTMLDGHIIPNTEDYPPAFDYAAVTVSLDGMLLRFIRGRMDFRVDVTPPQKPTAWRELSSVVKNSDLSGDPNRKVDYFGLNDFGRFFQANYDIIRHEVNKPDWRSPTGWLVPIT